MMHFASEYFGLEIVLQDFIFFPRSLVNYSSRYRDIRID